MLMMHPGTAAQRARKASPPCPMMHPIWRSSTLTMEVIVGINPRGAPIGTVHGTPYGTAYGMDMTDENEDGASTGVPCEADTDTDTAGDNDGVKVVEG